MKELHDNYIYAIAQGRTLDYINSFKQGAVDARTELQALADSVATLEMGYSPAFIPPDSQQISFAALKALAMQEKTQEIRPFTKEFK